jgi:hypothetical protein
MEKRTLSDHNQAFSSCLLQQNILAIGLHHETSGNVRMEIDGFNPGFSGDMKSEFSPKYFQVNISFPYDIWLGSAGNCQCGCGSAAAAG